ncbi:MAG: MerR family transcriptional regulator [Bacteroidota bacterium]|jgi:DNA-binding transcriptional MerR regulator|nr:MerR family transcriptional regulator [Bacteroidota bacterium]
MTANTYSTKEIAELTGVHPNTIRLYESWGYISKPSRLKNNYRVFTDLHLLQMKLARTALPGPYPVNGKRVHQLVKEFAKGNLEESLALAREYLEKVKLEQKRALRALNILDDWFAKRSCRNNDVLIKGRLKAAQMIGVTLDTLRTWERNGLYAIKKDKNGVLAYTQFDLERIEVIRLLRNCGYSIVSLSKVFNRQDVITEKPSLLLSLPINDEDFFYVTDRFMQYLQSHEKRAQSLIDMIEDYMKREQ